MRKPFVAGNWKMNLTLDESVSLAKGLREKLADVKDVDLAVFPPYVYLPAVLDALKGSNISVGAQDASNEKSGAFTGEVSADMLKDIGCDMVIIGHSERRHVIGEKDRLLNLKVRRALDSGLHVICCVGELLEERDAGLTEDVVAWQVWCGLHGLSTEQMNNVTIAYEPVWAIGTGRTATREQAQEVHAVIRALLSERFSGEVADSVRIQYGGSVKPDNAAELMSAADIDGALVGGASLKADSFAGIAKAALA